MNYKGIERQIQKLVASSSQISEVSVAYQAEQALRHWRETGEFSCPDGSRVAVEVFREVIRASPSSSPERAQIG